MAPHLVFGAGGIGTTAKSFTFTWDTPDKVAALLDDLQRLGVTELDSAASYPPTNPWNTETLLGQAKAADKGFTIDSKVLARRGAEGPLPSLTPALIEESIDKTLSLLGVPKVRTLYAHMNDGVTPLEEQAAGFDKQYRLGKFEKYGLSNYKAADVAKFLEICEANGYVKPSVYEGLYNALCREPEAELLPLLRKHNIAYYAYSPLAGGFLTGKVTFATDGGLDRTRWRGEAAFPMYVQLFDTPDMHAAIRRLKAACDAASPTLTLQEAAMRWLVHHSALQDGDGIIFGAKTVAQIETNVAETRRGPLPDEVRVVVDGLFEIARKKDDAQKSFFK